MISKEEFGLKLLSYLKSINWRIRAITICGVEDFHPDQFVALPNGWDTFNDSMFVVTDKGELLLNAWCTTESSKYWTTNPMNPKGGARIQLGKQFTDAWAIGHHKNQYPALVQIKPITVFRDKNKDGMRVGDGIDIGIFGINIHTTGSTTGFSPSTVSTWSAGCTVLQNSTTFYNKLMPLVINSGMKTVDYGVLDGTVVDAYIKQGQPVINKQLISEKGLELIRSFESLRLKAYRDPVGIPTIGYGHTKNVKMGDEITKEQAEKILLDETSEFTRGVLQLVKVPLNQNELDALTSFSFNVGLTAFKDSTLLKELNSGRRENAADQMLRWNKADGEVLAGLTRRRQAERALFLS